MNTAARTIKSVMMGDVTGHVCFGTVYNIPHSAIDMRDCFWLLRIALAWRARIDEVGIVFPKWRPITDQWHRLEGLYEADDMAGIDEALTAVYRECMVLDGWKTVGAHLYTREPHNLSLGFMKTIIMPRKKTIVLISDDMLAKMEVDRRE